MHCAAGRPRWKVLCTLEGAHERTIRELKMSDAGVEIGEPLEAFHGVLTGVPTYLAKVLPGIEPSAQPGSGE